MHDTDFDTALVTAALRLAGEEGWDRVNVAAAARAAGLSLAQARERFPMRAAILLRFGRLADQAALLDVPSDGPVRDRLFDLLMRRFDLLQTHRLGVRAVIRYALRDPPTAMMLASATKRSMRWMLQAAGVGATGIRGEVQVQGLIAVWLWAYRAWERDESEDLSGTMSAIDTALQRAEQAAEWLHGQRKEPIAPPTVSAGAGELDPSVPPPEGDPPLTDLPPSDPPQPDPPQPDPPLPGSPV